MNRIEQRFADLSRDKQPAFIPFITAGDPTLDATRRIVLALAEAGADVVELGVPFSDPLADGVVNQEAAQRALEHEVTLEHILGTVREIRKESEVPIVLFTYYNPVLAYGQEVLARDARDAGVDGILCVDLPPEEAGPYKEAFDGAGLSTIFLIAPTSTDKRIELISRASSGFIYYVSRTGVTGEQESIDETVREMVAKVKSHADLPVCVGFGISNPAQAAEIASSADGVVVGSAIVRMIGRLGDQEDMPRQVGDFVRTLVEASKTAS